MAKTRRDAHSKISDKKDWLNKKEELELWIKYKFLKFGMLLVSQYFTFEQRYVLSLYDKILARYVSLIVK